MDLDDIIQFAIPGFFVAVVAWVLYSNARTARRARADKERNEALFTSMFPDLQPWFHPKKLIPYVKARRASKPSQSGKVWKAPPGFGVHDAEIRFDQGKEQVRLRDAAGAVLAMFLFEEHKEGGVLRFGKGKFTVNIREAVPRVRYWHPDREFKWSEPKGWTFVTRMADEPFSGSSSSDSSSSNWSDSSRTAAAAGAAGVAVAGAGGAFDGGGASQGWDDAGGTASSTTSY